MYELVIVDDEEIIRRGLETTVDWTSLGFRVAGVFATAEGVVDFARARRLDVVLADIRMPGMSGLDLAAELKRIGCPAKVVILSGYDSFKYAQRAIECDVFGYLLKPSKPGEIKEIVGRLKSLLDREREQEGVVAAAQLLVAERDRSAHGETQGAGDDKPRKLALLAASTVRRRFAEDIGLESVAADLGVTPEHLSRLFKKELGMNFRDFLVDTRIAEARRLLRDPARKVFEVAAMAGFHDQRYFSEIFRRRTGLSPLEFRESSE